MRYFEQLRISWIVETIKIFGFINRRHVVKKFGVTQHVVSSDFSKVQEMHPDLMKYDASQKCYFLSKNADLTHEDYVDG